MITQYGPLSSGFIRRRIARYHYRATNRDAEQWDDDQIDEQIDQQVRILKADRRDRQTSFPDEIYIECLIRTDFVTQKALKMFDDNRPILVRSLIPSTAPSQSIPILFSSSDTTRSTK